MRLVKIDGVYINVDMVDAISFGSTKGITHVFIGCSENPFIFNRDIDEVVAIIEQEIEKPVLDKIRAEIEQKLEQEEFARSVFRHKEKDNTKADQCTGSIMAYRNVLKMLDKYKAESEE